MNSRSWTAVGGAGLIVAIAQSLCTAVLTISGIRVAIGLSALAAASGIYAPAEGFHQDAIRIPMLILATVGAIVNLVVLAWIRHLRSRPSAQWRRRELSAKEKRSEKLQVAMAILTLILVGLETWTHPMVHRTGPPPGAASRHNVSEMRVRAASLTRHSDASAHASQLKQGESGDAGIVPEGERFSRMKGEAKNRAEESEAQNRLFTGGEVEEIGLFIKY